MIKLLSFWSFYSSVSIISGDLRPTWNKNPCISSWKGFFTKQVYLNIWLLWHSNISSEPIIASRGHPRRIKSCPDGILQEGDLHHQPVGEKKEAGVGHVPEVVVGVEAKAEVLVLRTRQGQRHLILNDWERNLLNQRAKEEKLRRGKRMLKGEEHLFKFWKLQNLHRKEYYFAICSTESDWDLNKSTLCGLLGGSKSQMWEMQITLLSVSACNWIHVSRLKRVLLKRTMG